MTFKLVELLPIGYGYYEISVNQFHQSLETELETLPESMRIVVHSVEKCSPIGKRKIRVVNFVCSQL